LIESMSRPSSNLSINHSPIERVLSLIYTKNDAPKILDVGSGNRRIHKEVVCMDIYGSENIDIIGDACDIPIKSRSIDSIFMITVMKYVDRPFNVVDEFYRVLKPEGYICVSAPFLHPPFNEDSDKFRFTISGVRSLFSRFFSLEVILFQVL